MRMTFSILKIKHNQNLVNFLSSIRNNLRKSLQKRQVKIVNLPRISMMTMNRYMKR